MRSISSLSLAAIAFLPFGPVSAQEQSEDSDYREILPRGEPRPSLEEYLAQGGKVPEPKSPQSAAPTQSEAPPTQTSEVPSVLAIFAHPDDEIMFAPVLSRIAREGGEVTLVYATSGDAGPGVSGMEPGDELGDLRQAEAECAAKALKLGSPIFWKLGDGKLSDFARGDQSLGPTLARRIGEVIAEKNPQVIMTWGPDGGYGHSDHRMVSAAATQVVQTLGIERPELLYSVIPDGSRPQIAAFDSWSTVHPSLVTDRIRYMPLDLYNAREAMDCHKSQFGAEAREGLPDLLHNTVWRGTVFFRLAFPEPVEPE
ncbi:PIG-L deacetylase family protein [Erythrobacter crassostreae]|uniref:PIG-L family deacetylase n=1 Tax=Erythrobacter crassostreae TaxID=2828328 RepID=A0A9X1F2A2_9SPHN|nr:PIG-L family deacetylase [Erythrobacter crassostrea]MBV7258824.1 PIG-L family deacetylase [Erythrobacter crassostrea]